MKLFKSLAPGGVLLLLMLIIGCGPKAVVKGELDIPDWYLNPPVAPSTFYGTGEHTGPDLGLTRQAADAAARKAIADQVQVQVDGMLEQAKRQTGDELDVNVTTSALRQVTSQVLSGVKIEKREVKPKTGGYIVYSLATLDLGALQAAMKEAIAAKNLAESEDILRKMDESIDKMKTN